MAERKIRKAMDEGAFDKLDGADGGWGTKIRC